MTDRLERIIRIQRFLLDQREYEAFMLMQMCFMDILSEARRTPLTIDQLS